MTRLCLALFVSSHQEAGFQDAAANRFFCKEVCNNMQGRRFKECQMNEQKSILEDSLSFAWTKTWGNIVDLLKCMGIPLVVSIIISFILDFVLGAMGKGPFQALLKMLLMLPVQLILQMGMINIALKVYNGESFDLPDFFQTKGNIIQFFIGSFCYSASVLAGILLLIFPAFIWGTKFSFFDVRIVDTGIDGIDGFKDSGKITDGSKMELLMLYLLLLAIQVGGLICLLIGLIPAQIICFLAKVYAYKRCLQNHPELA
jgi:hypothetical protein